MAVQTIGRIKQVFKGAYDASTAYIVDDIVSYTDGIIPGYYICTAASTGNAPSTSGTVHGSWAVQSKGPGGIWTDITMGAASSNIKVNTGASAVEFGSVGASQKQLVKTANYVITNADCGGANELVVSCNAVGADRTITLPPLSSANLAAMIITVYVDTNTTVTSGVGQYEVKLNQDAADNSGAEIWSGTKQGDFVRLCKIGSAWQILDHRETYFEHRWMNSDQYIDGYNQEHLTAGGWNVYQNSTRNGVLDGNSWGNCWNTSNNEFVAPFDCWVDMNLDACFPGEGNDNGLTTSWKVNGTTIYRQAGRHSDGRISGPDGTCRIVMPCSATWDIEPWCQNMDDNGCNTYGGASGQRTQLHIRAWRRYW